MIITTKQTFIISPDNEPFVYALVQNAKDKGYIPEDASIEESLRNILAVPFQNMTREMAVSFIKEYFGTAGKGNADALTELIDNGALETTLEITESIV